LKASAGPGEKKASAATIAMAMIRRMVHSRRFQAPAS
jgi:hypothetical protein